MTVKQAEKREIEKVRVQQIRDELRSPAIRHEGAEKEEPPHPPAHHPILITPPTSHSRFDGLSREQLIATILGLEEQLAALKKETNRK